jgi:hypothetical protein
MVISHSYGHLLVTTGYKWDYKFYKWGFVNTVLLILITGISGHNCSYFVNGFYLGIWVIRQIQTN